MEALGIFADVKSAAEAVSGLIREGFAENQITSLSSVAYPDGVLVRARAQGWLRFVTLLSSLAGVVAGFALAAGTAWLYPVRTGAKPIIALFPAGIVTFEVTMLFALIGTMVGMFLEMRLVSQRGKLYDPAIAEGFIGISLTLHQPGEVVVCGRKPEEIAACLGSIMTLPVSEQRIRAEEIMTRAGALRTIMEPSKWEPSQ